VADKQVTKDSQTRTLRGWILGFHATHILNVGGRLGYFAELRRLGGAAYAKDLAAGLGLDPWRTEVWCRAACTVGVLTYDDARGFSFGPFMDEILADEAPDLPMMHTLVSLSRDFFTYPDAFRTGATKPFSDHDADFFSYQGKVSVQRAPLVVSVARQLPTMEDRLRAGGAMMDIGSGSGTVLVRFAEEFPQCRVTGVEPLSYFQDVSRTMLQERGLADRVRIVSDGGEGINFKNEFDLITMVQVFHELPDGAKMEILRRCHESLKPGGVLLLIDRCSPVNGADLRDRRFTMSILEQWFEVTWGNIVNTRPDILQMLNDAGFTVTQENAELVPTYWTFVAEKQG
jgi:SAM-dependent methyltransferase